MAAASVVYWEEIPSDKPQPKNPQGRAPQPPKAPELNLKAMDADFGNTIRLAGYEYEARVPLTQTTALTVTLLWEATGTPITDYTAFVHLLDRNGKYVTGFDRPPAENRIPTHYWKPGDRSVSVLTPRVPGGLAPGTYQLWAGLYDTQSKGLARLPVSAANLPVQNQSVLLGTIEFSTVP